ncbi:hypothetical protein A2U01_0080681 [Trifolium medium]|uniref:Uncharacterized protein n=1 Tax=Trifolium medium TaxID=97028 RepID=A0A392TH40_9FABA|nr:hypothetical protein [Trifolium medium]
MPCPSSLVNEISGIGENEVCPTNFASNSARLVYRLLAELDLPPPANPPAIVLTDILTFYSPLFPFERFSGWQLCCFGIAVFP